MDIDFCKKAVWCVALEEGAYLELDVEFEWMVQITKPTRYKYLLPRSVLRYLYF